MSSARRTEGGGFGGLRVATAAVGCGVLVLLGVALGPEGAEARSGVGGVGSVGARARIAEAPTLTNPAEQRAEMIAVLREIEGRLAAIEGRVGGALDGGVPVRAAGAR